MEYEDDDHADRAAQLALPSVGRPRSSRGRRLSWLKHSFSSLVSVRPSSRPSTTPTQLRTNTNIILTTTNNNNNNDASVKLENHSVRTQTNQINNDDDHYRRRRRRKRRRKLLLQLEQEEAKIIKPQLPVMHTPSASPKILVALALLAWCPSLIIAIGPHMLFSEDSSVRLGGDDELMMKFTSDQLATSLVPHEKPQDNQNLSKRDNNSSNNNNSTSTTEETPMSQGAASQSTWSMLMAALFEYQAVGERTGSFGDIYDDRQAGTSTEVNDNDKYNESSSYTVNWPNLILALVLILLMLTTAIGNLFVIVAILIERNLRTLGNYLVLSLAIADLLVALLVMPLASIYLILDSWTLGVRLCDIWTSADVFCCTASILHLLAIALDRYWAVTRVDYIRCQRNDRRILSMIFCVWMAAGVISLAPAFGWKDAEYEERILNNKECLISQDIGYQIFATCTTFYFPLTLTLIFYWKIYQVARKRIRRKLDNRAKLKPPHPSSTSSGSIVPTTGGHGGGGNKTKQIAKNQSIVKYSQRPGAAAKFTTSSTGPVLQGTISGSRSIAVTNRPASSACDCLCHKSNQAQSDGTTSAATATKSDGAKQATTATTTEPIAVRPQPSEMEPRRADMDGAKAAGANSNCQAAGGLQKQPTASLLQADEKVLGGDCGKPDGEEAQAAQDSKRNNRNNNALGNEGAEEANKKAQTNGQIVDFNDDDNQDDEGAGGRPGKTATAETVIADECGAIAEEDDAVKQQATTVPVCTNGENLSHGRKRRQSNLNSSCSRCRRNQFQDESQSESLASCSRASSLQANDEYGLEEEEEENQDDEGGALGANSRNYSSLSSNNCTHGLLLMDTNSLDGGTSDQMSSMPAAARRTARASVAALPSHRKSLGVVVGVGRRLSTNGCDCCTACTICCHPEQLMQIGDSELVGNADSKPMSDGINQQMAAAAAETTTTTTNRSTHPNTWQRTDSNSVSQSQELNLGHSLDNRRALEVTLDKEGRMTCGLIEPACQPVRECSIDMLGCPRLEDASGNINNNNNLDGMSKERRNCAAGLLSNNGSASWFTATRRKVKRRLAPLEPTRNIMAICWRHLVMATLAQFRVGHSNQQQQQQQQQAFESAGDVMATDQHSTSVLIVGNQHHCVVGQPTVTSTTMNYQASSQFDDEDYVASGNLNRIAVVVCQVCQCPQLALGTTTNTTANMTTNTVAPVSATGKFDADERDKLESSGNQDERGEEDTTTSSSMQQRQVADSVCRADTDSANLVAVVACTTTNIALTTAEGPNQKSGDSASIAAAAYPNHGRPLLEHCSPSQKPRLFLLQQQHSMQSSPTIQSHAAQMEGVESKRERKAAKTLAIITGVFVMCWLPFFMMAIAMPLLQLKPHKYLFAFLLWLGYFNSMLNPIIYTIFSPDFRKAFKRLLCGSDEDGQRKKRQRAACGGTSSSCIQSNGNRNGNGMSSRCRTGGGDRSNDGYLTAIGDRLRDISPALSRWLSCTGGDTGNGNCHNNSHEKKGHCGGNQLGGTMPLDTNININMLTGTNEGRFTPNTAMITPNSSPTIIPGKQQSPASNYMSSPNRPKSIITNHF